MLRWNRSEIVIVESLTAAGSATSKEDFLASKAACYFFKNPGQEKISEELCNDMQKTVGCNLLIPSFVAL